MTPDQAEGRLVTFHDFEAEDMLAIDLQATQLLEAGYAAPRTLAEAQDRYGHGAAWTARDGDGRVLCCAGLYELAPGRHAIAWAMLARDIGVAAHLSITRFARARIVRSALRRIDSYVVADPAGRCAKWAAACGMTLRAELPCWGAGSDTVLLFDRVLATPTGGAS